MNGNTKRPKIVGDLRRWWVRLVVEMVLDSDSGGEESYKKKNKCDIEIEGIALCLLKRLDAPYLLRRLVAHYLLRRLVAPYFLRRLAASYLLRRLDAPYLLRRLVASYLMRRLAAPYLMRRLAALYLLRRLDTSYLLRRRYSLVIVSGPEFSRSVVRPELSGSSRVIWLVQSWLVSAEVVGLDWRWFVSIIEVGVDWRWFVLIRELVVSVGGTRQKLGFRPALVSFRVGCLDRRIIVRREGYIELVRSLSRLEFDLNWISVGDRVPTSFNQGHTDQLKAHIMKLHDISEGVLVRSGLSRVWRNPMCDPVLRRSDNTVMSIYDFLCMPSLDKVTVREEPHGLDTSILGRVADRTTSPAPASIAIPPRNEVEQADDGTLNDDDQRDGLEFAMEGIESLNDISQDKNVEPHADLSGGVRRATRASFHASHGISEDVSPRDQEVPPALNVQSQDADDGGNGSDGSGNDSSPYTKDDWEEIHGINLGLRKEELYKDHKNVDRLTKRCSQLTQIIKKQNADIKQQSESIDRANEEVSRLTAQLGVLKSRCQKAKQKLSSWDKKHKKYRNERDTLAMEKSKIKEELVGPKSQLEHRERQAEEIQGSIASFFQSYFTPLVRRFLKSGEFDRQLRTSFATSSLRANTHVRHSTSSSETFGHTSTSKHLKKKKKSVET
uniref:Uncharacterized protein n=1 Tax=Tanacetum cinerariifolium TaxID=118510 RepID=A0A699GWB8_TANCI|nr:hypothetical protein [Tanacetum cinerariifolium]